MLSTYARVKFSGVFTGDDMAMESWRIDSLLVSYLLLIYNVVLSMISELPSPLREIKCLVTYIPPPKYATG